jgi:hypothetical protein
MGTGRAFDLFPSATTIRGLPRARSEILEEPRERHLEGVVVFPV